MMFFEIFIAENEGVRELMPQKILHGTILMKISVYYC